MGLRLKKDDGSTGQEQLTEKNMGSKGGVVIIGMAAIADLSEHGQVTFILSRDGNVRQVEPRQVAIRKPTPDELIDSAVAQGKGESEILEMLGKLESMPDDPREWTL